LSLKRISTTSGIAAVLLVGSTAVAGAASVPANAVSKVAANAPSAMATATTTSTTHSCRTSGYSYQVDSVYVTRSWDSAYGKWKYVVTRTPNHTAYDANHHEYDHSALYLHAYWSSSSMTTYSNPANSTTVRSSSSIVDFRMVFKIIVDGGLHSYTESCDVNF
jgi:hypothetical protein